MSNTILDVIRFNITNLEEEAIATGDKNFARKCEDVLNRLNYSTVSNMTNSLIDAISEISDENLKNALLANTALLVIELLS